MPVSTTIHIFNNPLSKNADLSNMTKFYYFSRKYFSDISKYLSVYIIILLMNNDVLLFAKYSFQSKTVRRVQKSHHATEKYLILFIVLK